MAEGNSESITMEKMRKLILESLDIKLDEKLQVLHEVKSDVDRLKATVKELEYRVEDADAYSRRNCIVFHGIPFDANENPMDLATQLGAALDVEIHPNDIDDLHRLRTRNPVGPPPFIIKLVNRWKRNALMANTRIKKLNAGPWGGSIDQRIFANEHLTRRNQAILAEARRHKEFFAVWSWKGNIFYRTKLEGSEVLQLTDVEDAKTLSNQLSPEEKEKIRTTTTNKLKDPKGKPTPVISPAVNTPSQGVSSKSRQYNTSSRSPYKTRSFK